jgi:hypothetical protein
VWIATPSPYDSFIHSIPPIFIGAPAKAGVPSARGGTEIVEIPFLAFSFLFFPQCRTPKNSGAEKGSIKGSASWK